MVLVGLSPDDRHDRPDWQWPEWTPPPQVRFGEIRWDGVALIFNGAVWVEVTREVVPWFPGILAIWQGALWAKVGDVWAEVA